jgi:hypothetical protein
VLRGARNGWPPFPVAASAALSNVKHGIGSPLYKARARMVPARAGAREQRSISMSTLHGLEIGFLAGIVLFFVLQRMGVIDRWFESMER